MDVHPVARSVTRSERQTDMADLHKCIGSTRFGIEAHEAPVGDFPIQPSQKDGLGRMCKPHWNQYTTALRKAALATKAEGSAPEPIETTTEVVEARARGAKSKEPVAEITEGATA
jgi:hypothetical protein